MARGLVDQFPSVDDYRDCLARAHDNRGDAYLKRGDYDKAFVDFTDSLQLKPDDLETKCKRAEACWRNVGVLYNRKNARLLKQQGRSDEAIRAYDRAIQMATEVIQSAPDLADAYNVRAGAYLDSGSFDAPRFDEAIADYKRVIQLDPGRAAAYLNLGWAYDAKREFRKAIDHFNTGIRMVKRPGVVTLHGRAKTYVKMGEFDKAIADYTRAIEYEPQRLDSYSARATVHLRKGEPEEAVADYTRLIRLDRKNYGAFLCRGIIYRDTLNDFDKALADFSQAIDLDPVAPVAHVNCGLAYEKRGLLEEAIAACSEAIRLAPDDCRAYRIRASVHSKRGQFDEAVSGYRKAIELSPECPTCCNDFAWFLVSCRDPRFRDSDQAMRLSNTVASLLPRSPDAQNTLGFVHYRAGNWQASVEALQKAVKLRAGGHAADWFFLAMAHRQLGNKEQAQRNYDLAVAWMGENAPHDEELIHFQTEAAELLGLSVIPPQKKETRTDSILETD